MKKLLNIICTIKLKNSIIIIFLLFLYISFSAISYVNAVSSNISDNVLRLHVIANSDSYEDQALKLKVRDKVLEYMNSICKDITNKDDAINILNSNLDTFNEIASNTIKENGYNYGVNIEVGNFSFPTKNYGDISFPAGFYDALRIKIGNAEGKNWWCVMFPPLCFVDVSSGIVPDDSKEILKEDLTDEEYSLISDKDNSTIKFKFKLIEWLENAKILTAKK